MRRPTTDQIADRCAITDVIHRYCRGVDRFDFELVRSCYHPDAVDEHGSFVGTVDEYLAWVRTQLEKYQVTFHAVSNVLVEFDGEQARCETYGIAHHRGRRDDPPHRNLITGFRYVDRFECRDGDWRIVHRIAITEWSRVDDPEQWWKVPDHMRSGRRDSSDPAFWPLDGPWPPAPPAG